MVALKDINKCRCSQDENEPILKKITTENELCTFHMCPKPLKEQRNNIGLTKE